MDHSFEQLAFRRFALSMLEAEQILSKYTFERITANEWRRGAVGTCDYGQR